MKKVEDFILREIAGEYVLVPTGSASKVFDGIITFNEQAAFLWNNIDECETVEALVKKLTDEYDVDAEVAKRDVEVFVSQLLAAGIINK